MNNKHAFWSLALVLAIILDPVLVFAVTCRDDIATSAPDSRFTDNGDGTVTDLATKLIWKQCSEGLSGADCKFGNVMTFTWQAALQHASDADYAGSNLWRLPNKKELISLVEQRCYDPAINTHFFPNTPGGYFWSSSPGWWSSPNGFYPEAAWNVSFYDGYVYVQPMAIAQYVRLVRGGLPRVDNFVDVPISNWAYDYIHAIRDAGITTGCGNNNFCPAILVTREQMSAFLIRAIEGDPQSNLCATGSPYSDVPIGAWYCSHVKRLVDLAITGGCGQGNYCPANQVTREQMAAFIVRAKVGELPQNYCGGMAPFNDVSPSTWSCGYIKKLVELGITQGCGNGNYCPTTSVTREQMAAFLARAFLNMD